MGFTINLWPYDRWSGTEQLAEAVVELERMGYHAVSFPEHPPTPSGMQDAYGNVTWYDPFVLASYLSARTTDLHFLFKVLVVPMRHPLVAARLAATLDQVSRGRLIMGVAPGWNAAHYEAMGQDFDRRGALTDEFLAAMLSCWTDDRSTKSGSFGSWTDAIVEPKAFRTPHPTLWIGGDGSAAIRRAATVVDGWVPMAANLSFETARATVHTIRDPRRRWDVTRTGSTSPSG